MKNPSSTGGKRAGSASAQPRRLEDEGGLYRVVVVDPQTGELSPCSEWQPDNPTLHELAQKLRGEGRNAHVVVQESITIDPTTIRWNWDPDALKVTEAALQQAEQRPPVVHLIPGRLYTVDAAARLIAGSICPPTAPPTDENNTPIGGTSTPFESYRVSCLLQCYRMFRDGRIVPRERFTRLPARTLPEVWNPDQNERYVLTADQIAVLCEERGIATHLASPAAAGVTEADDRAPQARSGSGDDTAAAGPDSDDTWIDHAVSILDAHLEEQMASASVMLGRQDEYVEHALAELAKRSIANTRGRPPSRASIAKDVMRGKVQWWKTAENRWRAHLAGKAGK